MYIKKVTSQEQNPYEKPKTARNSLDFPASRTVRKYISVKIVSVWYFVRAA